MRSVPLVPLVALIAGQAVAASAPLVGEWRVEQVSGAPVVAGSEVSMRFETDGKVSGKGSCNRYGASYRLEKDRISFTPAMATRKACAPDLMAQEALFFSIIENAVRWTYADGRLTITTADGLSVRAARAE